VGRTPRWWRPRGFALVAAGACLLAPSARGEAAVSLAELDALLQRHPALAGLAAQAESSRERAVSLRGLPDPKLSIGLNNYPLLDPSLDEYLPTSRSIGVVQSIPNVRVRKASARAEARRAHVDDLVRAQTLDRLRARLVAALVERERIEQQRRLSSERGLRYDELVEVVAAEIDAGRPVSFRLAQIDVEQADVARQLVELEERSMRVDAELVELVGYPAYAPPPPQQLLARSGTADDFHAVRVARARTSVADAQITRAEGAFGADWEVSFTWQFREAGAGGPGADFDGDDWVTARLAFTLPVWGEQRQAPDLRAARADRAARQSETMSLARASEARWSAHMAALTAAARSMDILRAKLDAMDEQIAARRTNYEAGLGDYSQVLDAEIARLALESELVDERARHARTLAEANAMLAAVPGAGS
jgi:outer membrane protein TolC